MTDVIPFQVVSDDLRKLRKESAPPRGRWAEHVVALLAGKTIYLKGVTSSSDVVKNLRQNVANRTQKSRHLTARKTNIEGPGVLLWLEGPDWSSEDMGGSSR